jgi:hypothetical protein
VTRMRACSPTGFRVSALSLPGVALLASVGLLVAGCGGSSSSTSTPAVPASPAAVASAQGTAATTDVQDADLQGQLPALARGRDGARRRRLAEPSGARLPDHLRVGPG